MIIVFEPNNDNHIQMKIKQIKQIHVLF